MLNQRSQTQHCPPPHAPSLLSSCRWCIILFLLCSAAKTQAAPKAHQTASPKASPKPKAIKAPKKLDPNRLEWGAIGGPAVNVDTGIEIGGFVHFARFRQGFFPYFWRLRFTFRFSMRPTPNGIEFPIHNYNVSLDLPGLLGGRLRVQAKLGFQSLIAQYYGLGNAADGTRHWLQFDADRERDQYVRALRRYQYRQTTPYASLDIRWQLSGKWLLFAGFSWSYVLLERYEGSQLERDHRQGRNAPRSAAGTLLFGTTPHALLRGQIGLLWDARNNEFAPTSGWLHEISLRASPGPLLGLQHGYGGANVTLRFYAPLWRDRLVFATRAVADVLWGQVPFYRMTATGGLFGTDTFGGGSSIRGLRAARYHGKAKLWGNLELRARIVDFVVARTYFSIGITAFFDMGRVWLDYGRFSALDGTDVGLHIGTGGGIRVRWGKSLLIRFDLAWSPDANPVGFYFLLGHIF